MKRKRTPERDRGAREERDDLRDEDADFEYERPRSRARRRGSPWRKLLVFLVVVALVVAALPTIVAKTPLRNSLISSALPAGSVRVSVADASLSWFGAPAFRGVDVFDAAGARLASVESIETSRSPLALASNWRDLGEITVTRPVVYLAVRPDGTNWQDALRPFSGDAVDDASGASESQKASELPAVAARVVDGTVLVEETATGQRWRLFGLNADIDTRGVTQGLPPVSVAGQIDAGDATNLIAATPASFSLGLKNEQGRQQLAWQLQNLPLAAAEPWLRLQTPGAVIRGGVVGNGTATWSSTAANPLSDCATAGTLTVQSLDFTSPDMAGDHLRLASVELPWRLTAQPAGVTIDDLQLRSDVGRLAVRGSFDPAILVRASDVETATFNTEARHDVEFQGEVDLAPLAAMLPHLLRIRSDTTITGGKLQLTGRSQPIAGGQSLSGMLRTTGLAATSAGKPLSWNQPVDATFELRRVEGQARLESLKCQSDFLNVSAAGTIDQLTADASFDLNRLATQLGQFVDLTSAQMAGTGTAHLDWQKTGSNQFVAKANSDLAQLRVAFGDGKIWAEPRLALKVGVEGTLDPTTHRPVQVAAALVEVEAEGDQLVARTTAPVDCAMANPRWPVNVNMKGEISQWLARVRPWVAIDPWQASGLSQLSADMVAASDAADVTNAKLTVTNLRVAGDGLTIQESRVEISGDMHWNGATGSIASKSVQLVSSAVSLAAQDVELQTAGGGPPRANGIAAFRTDLARLAAWSAVPGQPAAFQPQGMVTGNLRFDQQANQLTAELNATGEKMLLAQLAGAAGYQTIWQEPQVNVRGITTYEPAADRLAFKQFQVQSATLAVMADGQVDRLSTTADVNANGAINYDLAQFTPLLKPFIGEGVQLVGRETARFQANGSLASAAGYSHWSQTLQARFEAPWQSANVYGLPIGPGKLGATLGQGLVRVDPLSISVAEGQLTTAPQVRLDPEPQELTLPPGPLLTNVRISPQVSQAMLQYIAPVLAGATQSEGQFSLTMSNARVPMSDSKKADMAGQLAVHSVRVVPGPMAKQWVELAQQIEAIAKKRDLSSLAGRPPAALLTVQDQQVAFRVVDGRVYHKDMQFQVGDVTLRSEGSVGFDETVAIMLHVPIQDKWVEGQAMLVGLKGQSLTIPISGTLRQPRMDQSAVSGLSRQLLQGAAQQAIGGELNKALDKLFKPR